MENKIIIDLEQEFKFEISEYKIKIDDLKFVGVSELSLKEEAYLRNIFGDEILENLEKADEFIDLSKKSISKINANEIEKTSGVSNLIDSVQNSEFNSDLRVVLSKIREEVDE